MSLIWVLLIAIAIACPAQAEITDAFQFTDVASVGLPGNPDNASFLVTSTVESTYTLGTIEWSGTVSATPDPDDPDVFPSWGSDLGLRVTHLPSGAQADIRLGRGGELSVEPAAFAGSSRSLNGVQVAPGDTFDFEFLESFNDPVVSPDAVWHSIDFFLSDDAALPLGPPNDGLVRLSTIGRNTFPTSLGTDGAEFFRIEYGAGDGPAIAQAVLNTHAAAHDDVWFDSDEMGESADTDGTIQVNFLDGVEPPLAYFEVEDTEPAFAGDFAVLRLAFEPDTFRPGGAVHFGIDTDGGFVGPPAGDAFAFLDPPLSFTVLFEDGTLVVSDDWRVRQDVEDAALVQADIRGRTLWADFDADRDVDGDDLLKLLLQFGQGPMVTHTQGDADGNGSVNSVDIAVWRQQFGRRLPAAGITPARAVPEPNTVMVAATVIVGLLLMWPLGRLASGGG